MVAIPDARAGVGPFRPSLNLRQLAVVAAAIAGFWFVAFDPRALNDGDTYWHIAAGTWMLDHGRIATVDPLSYTHYGQPWVAHEWLSEIIMTLVWRAAGWTGIVVMFGLAVALSMALLIGRMARWLGPIALGLAAWLCIGCMWVGLFTRPHLFALPIMIFWTGALLDARAQNRAPPLWLAGLLVLWANLHGSFVFGALVAAPLALEALIEARGDSWPVLRAWTIFGGLCLVAVLLTPHGIEGLIYPFRIMSMQTLNGIVEWRPPDFTKWTEFQAAVLLVILVCLARGVKVPVLRALLVVFLLHMALLHQRHELVLALIAPLFLAEPIGRGFGRAEPKPLGSLAAPLILFTAVMVVLVGWRAAHPVERGNAVNTPAEALAHVPADVRSKPVVNTYSFGGYLAFRGVRPFIDGRADMYGDDFFTHDMALMRGEDAEFTRTMNTYHVGWTILAPREPLVRKLDATPGWRRIYADRWAVVHVRDEGATKPGGPTP